MKYKISLIPLTYKSTKEEIYAFLNQISIFKRDIELIIVLEMDDRESYDYWLDELKKNNEIEYKLSFLKKTSSKGECLNEAIKKSSCDYFMRCDMDDFILPNRFEDTLKAIINSNKKYDLIYSDMIDLKNNKLLNYPIPRYIDIFSIFKNPIPAPTTCIKKEFIIKNNLKIPKTNRCEDLYLSLFFIDKKASFYKLFNPVVKYNNNNINRDYKNWLKNSLYRMRRNRYDLVGLLSILFGLTILILVLVRYLEYLLKFIFNILYKNIYNKSK